MQITGFHFTHRKTDPARTVQVRSLTDQQGYEWTAFSLDTRFELPEHAIQIRFDQQHRPWVLYRSGAEDDVQARLTKVVKHQFSETANLADRLPPVLPPTEPKVLPPRHSVDQIDVPKTTRSQSIPGSTGTDVTGSGKSALKASSLPSVSKTVVSKLPKTAVSVTANSKPVALHQPRNSGAKAEVANSVFAPPNSEGMETRAETAISRAGVKTPTEADFKAAELELPPWEISQLLPNQEAEDPEPPLEATYLPPVKSTWWRPWRKKSAILPEQSRALPTQPVVFPVQSAALSGQSVALPEQSAALPVQSAALSGQKEPAGKKASSFSTPHPDRYYRPPTAPVAHSRTQKRAWRPWPRQAPRLGGGSLSAEAEGWTQPYQWQKVKTENTEVSSGGEWNPEWESASPPRNNWAMAFSAVLAIGGVVYLILPATWLPFG